MKKLLFVAALLLSLVGGAGQASADSGSSGSAGVSWEDQNGQWFDVGVSWE